MKTVFIHGSAGTTGLRIRERLADRGDIETVVLPDELRHDPAAVQKALNSCDAAFLCLPDSAAREAAEWVENPEVIVLDTSTAHRTAPGWTYGFPELGGVQAEKLRSAKRIAVPGCHASGFVALAAPLVSKGLLPPDAALTCFSLTGYSGGGKNMIAEYRSGDRDSLLDAPRQYGLSQNHKHLPEMAAVCGLTTPPIFCPIVADYYSGMEVTVPVFAAQLRGTPEEVRAAYRETYTGPVVRWLESDGENGFLSASALSGSDRMDISVHGNSERLLLAARFDNLGKGASGAAIQCMNLAFGLDPTLGLAL